MSGMWNVVPHEWNVERGTTWVNVECGTTWVNVECGAT